MSMHVRVCARVHAYVCVCDWVVMVEVACSNSNKLSLYVSGHSHSKDSGNATSC